ncbi:DUF2301 domain-containing membrane protein [Aeromonas salmonicida]|uniref:DUF2301 domain-containing membrane protein n=1 Tax=Aeromonas salmonicida TaxID=645 RepID=UPI0023312470|nr:DUF2301 domain-containing membrane protein [Aeromonas salmonicida]WCH22566.1 DUF2301 domain-containing membrane protein [Aeromonas salmonicida]
MANPEIESELDGIDRLSVCFYRLGLSLAALLLVCRGASLLIGQDFLAPSVWLTALVVASGVCGLCLHVYDKRIRFILQVFAWGGLVLSASGAPQVLVLGASLATLSGLAFKEQFCFAIPGIKALPLLLPLLWGLEWAQLGWAAAPVALACGLLLGLLCLAKWRMPLHFDIGDKGRYQI